MSEMGQFETKIMSAMTAAFLRSGRRARATAALPTGINRRAASGGRRPLALTYLRKGSSPAWAEAKTRGAA
jgi:hypothetical protein